MMSAEAEGEAMKMMTSFCLNSLPAPTAFSMNSDQVLPRTNTRTRSIIGSQGVP
jgi:hypothetical protein